MESEWVLGEFDELLPQGQAIPQLTDLVLLGDGLNLDTVRRSLAPLIAEPSCLNFVDTFRDTATAELYTP